MTEDSDASTQSEQINLDEACEMFGGDRDLLRSIVEAFLIETPGLMNTIQSSFQAEDVKSIERAAHTMKSNFNNLCLRDTAQQCQEVEDLANQGNLIEIKNRLEPLNGRVQAVICRLQDYLKS